VAEVFYGLDALPLTQLTVSLHCRKRKALTPISGCFSSSSNELVTEWALLPLKHLSNASVSNNNEDDKSIYIVPLCLEIHRYDGGK